MTRAELSARKFGRGGRAFAPEFRSASRPRHRGFGPARPHFVVKVRRGGPGSAGLSTETSVEQRGFVPKFRSITAISYRNFGRSPRFCTEISVDHRDFKPKLRRGATETPAPGRSFAPRRPPRERSCGRDGPAAYKSSPERVCPRVVPKGRADRDRNGQTPHARAPAGADVMPVGRVSAAPIARSLCRSGVRTTLRARGRLQAVAAGA